MIGGGGIGTAQSSTNRRSLIDGSGGKHWVLLKISAIRGATPWLRFRRPESR
jgi:hypothetical protein